MDLKYKYVLVLLPFSLILILCLFLAVSTSTPMSPSLSTKVMDYDYNDDGVIDNTDRSLLQDHLGESTSVGSSNRKFDNNYDGVIDEADVNLLEQSKDLQLSGIASGLFTDETTFIDYYYRPVIGEGKDWDFTLFALNKNYVKTYWGSWLDIRHHPHVSYPDGYVCTDYALDMMKSSYKDLGYGTIAYASSLGHGYNIFYTGGDWHDLKNWMVLEPQSGWMVRADKPTKEVNSCWLPDCSYYKTKYILYPVGKFEESVDCVKLVVNFNDETVNKVVDGYTDRWIGGGEESSPENYDISYHPYQSLIPVVGFQITGVQAVTATAGVAVIAGAALYYVRYLR